MTIEEAAYNFGIKEYITSEGDSLHSVVVRLFGSYDDVYYIMLKKLNLRFDWFSLPPGATIKYLAKNVCSKLSEITSVTEVISTPVRRISSNALIVGSSKSHLEM